MAYKVASGIVSAIVPVVVWLFATFETAEGAEQWRVQHQQAINCRTVADLRAQIRGLTERLRFDSALTSEQRAWLQQQIANIQADIRRLDPNGIC